VSPTSGGIRIVLVHWNAEEAVPRLRLLRGAGHTVRVFPGKSGGPRDLLARPPALFLVDLDRAPGQGRDMAVWLRSRKATRHVPIVFAGGSEQAADAVRRLLPDAGFTEWTRVRSAVRAAVRRSPERPASPGVLAGYAGTPLPRKLGIRPGSTVVLLGAPRGFETALAPLPDGVRVRRTARGRPAQRVVLFAGSASDLRKRFPAAVRALDAGGSIWIAWRKKASGAASDLDQSGVRSFGLDAGFVDYKIGAIDATWSGLCFSRRKKAR
jgi:hypothetical protein